MPERMRGRAGPSVRADGEEPEPEMEVSTRGPVPDDAVAYARKQVAAGLELTGARVLFARVKLTAGTDPAVPRPYRAQAALDLDGAVLRAQGYGLSWQEAIDVLHQHLRDRIGHRADREQRRSTSLPPEAGEWRHGNLPADRPPYVVLPLDEREILRRKPIADEDLTVEEAAWDLHQLDYDFYLFRELGSGTDSLLHRTPNGLVLRQLEHNPSEVALGIVDATIDPEPAPALTLDGAVEWLDAEPGAAFVFFGDADSGRGAVLYRRHDGHYGLLGPIGAVHAIEGS